MVYIGEQFGIGQGEEPGIKEIIQRLHTCGPPAASETGPESPRSGKLGSVGTRL
jgi:hypothetical protein